MIERYHVFTHDKDIWVGDFQTAKAIFRRWKRYCDSARVYRERYEDE